MMIAWNIFKVFSAEVCEMLRGKISKLDLNLFSGG